MLLHTHIHIIIIIIIIIFFFFFFYNLILNHKTKNKKYTRGRRQDVHVPSGGHLTNTQACPHVPKSMWTCLKITLKLLVDLPPNYIHSVADVAFIP